MAHTRSKSIDSSTPLISGPSAPASAMNSRRNSSAGITTRRPSVSIAPARRQSNATLPPPSVTFEIPAAGIIKNTSSKSRALYPFYILLDIRKFRNSRAGRNNPLLLSQLPSKLAVPVLRGSSLAAYTDNAYRNAPQTEKLRRVGYVDGTGVPRDPSRVPAQPIAPPLPAWKRAKQSIDRRLAQAADRSRYIEIFPLGGTVPMPVPNLVNIQGKLTEKHVYTVSDCAVPVDIGSVKFSVPSNCWPRVCGSILYNDNVYGQQDCPVISLQLSAGSRSLPAAKSNLARAVVHVGMEGVRSLPDQRRQKQLSVTWLRSYPSVSEVQCRRVDAASDDEPLQM